MQRIIIEKTTSANEYAKKLAETENSDIVVIAKEQTAGRGRKGRCFYSPKGGIYMSFLLHPEINPEETLTVTVKAAVSTARAIENILGIRVDIKWVNDLYKDGKKVCGILTEGRYNSDKKAFDYVILGIGVNLFYPENGFPEDLKEIAGSLLSEEKDGVFNKLTEEIIKEFLLLYNSHTDYLSEYKSRSNILGKEIEYLENGRVYTAKAVDIDEKAELVVIKNGKKLCLNSGEVKINMKKLK